MVDVLVSLGCYNKMTETGWLIINRNLFLMVLETGKSKIRVPAWMHSGRAFLLVIASTSFLWPHMVESIRELCLWGPLEVPPL